MSDSFKILQSDQLENGPNHWLLAPYKYNIVSIVFNSLFDDNKIWVVWSFLTSQGRNLADDSRIDQELRNPIGIPVGKAVEFI